MMLTPAQVKRAWALVGPALLVGAYASASMAGASALVAGHQLDRVTSHSGAVMALIGGLFAGLSVPRSVWWLERTGLVLIAGAAGVRIALNVRVLGSNPWDAGVSIWWLVMVLCGLAMRAVIIRGYTLAPRHDS